MAKLTEDEIKSLCMQRVRSAESGDDVVQEDRRKAIQYYNCEPFGDERDGESKFVSSDVRDTIEWILPDLVEMFIGDENPGEFAAKDAKDVPQAKLETEYVRHVYNQQNNGFLNTYTWCKDGLLLKNGIVKSWWDERVDEIKETYEGKDINSYLALKNDQQVEIKAVTAYLDEQEFTEEEALALPPEALMGLKFDIEAVRKEDNSQTRIEPIPPENFFIEPGFKSLDLTECSFCCHRDTVKASDLIVDGYDRDLVDGISDGDESALDEESVERFEADGGDGAAEPYEDDLNRDITIYECYIRTDFNGDGKSELRMVKLAGKDGSTLLENEEVDSIPFSCWTPVIQTHKFYGLSIFDLIRDLQLLRSVLMRQMLNNIYLVNNPRKVVADGQVNMSDMLQVGPGSRIRVKQGADIDKVLRDDVTPFIGDKTSAIISIVQEMRNERTGVSPVSQGLDPDALADSTNIIGSTIMSQAQKRVKMVARIFAETGFKHLMRRIHELCSKHEKNRVFPMGQNYVPVDPRQWAKRTQYTVRVGVGHVDKLQRVQAINAVVQNHKEIAMAGGMETPVLSAQNFHTALVEQAKMLGYVDGEKFYRDPQTFTPPPKEDIASEALQIEEARTVADVQKAAASNAVELKKHNDEIQLKYKELEDRFALEEKKLRQDEMLRREEMLLRYGPGVHKDSKPAEAVQ